MNRFTQAERIGIECGIYQKLKLSEMAKKIGKTPGSVSREIRANRTVAPGEHPCGKDCCFAGECKTKGLCGKMGCSKRCVACREYDCRELCSRYNNRRKVAYKPRRKKKETSEGFLNQEFRKNRGYDDYLKYMEKHPDTPVIQMDTVKGCREQGKRLLTIHFCNTNMMLMLLMRDGKADTVMEQFDMLTGLLGLEEFRRIFPVILTDNGSEFKHTRDLETTEDGKKRTKVFYCDPKATNSLLFAFVKLM